MDPDHPANGSGGESTGAYEPDACQGFGELQADMVLWPVYQWDCGDNSLPESEIGDETCSSGQSVTYHHNGNSNQTNFTGTASVCEEFDMCVAGFENQSFINDSAMGNGERLLELCNSAYSTVADLQASHPGVFPSTVTPNNGAGLFHLVDYICTPRPTITHAQQTWTTAIHEFQQGFVNGGNFPGPGDTYTEYFPSCSSEFVADSTAPECEEALGDECSLVESGMNCSGYSTSQLQFRAGGCIGSICWDDRWEVRRALADRITSDAQNVLMQCEDDWRIDPVTHQFTELASTTLFYKLGLRVGDKVTEICNSQGSCSSNPVDMYVMVFNELETYGSFEVKAAWPYYGYWINKTIDPVLVLTY